MASKRQQRWDDRGQKEEITPYDGGLHITYEWLFSRDRDEVLPVLDLCTQHGLVLVEREPTGDYFRENFLGDPNHKVRCALNVVAVIFISYIFPRKDLRLSE